MKSVTTSLGAVRPAAPYLGGKRNLSRRLCEIIAATPHQTYVEPFVGMGGVFLRRQAPARVEVINDLSRDVATFFRILQRHYQAFLDMLKWQLSSRAEFARLLAVDPDTLTDLERAARFLYLQRTAFGGRVVDRTFGVSAGTPSRFDLTKLVPMLEDLHERLAPVTIECLPYADVIRRYDRPDTLFFLDPPYWNNEGDYGAGAFERADFQRLADQLYDISGKFILTVNATDGAREVFGRFAIEEVGTTYTVGTAHGGGKRVTELIVRGRKGEMP